MRRIYPAVLWVDDGQYFIRVPDVTGCLTSGSTIEEAIDMAKDALAGCICVLEDEGEAMPTASNPTDIQEDGKAVVLVDIDTMRYREETDTRTIRKNVSMPAYLANLAERKGINCSQLLQNALKKELELVY